MNRVIGTAVAALALVAAAPASANIGVPMVAVFLPPLWLSLVPVILLEAWVLAKQLQLSAKTSLIGAALGNVVSTVVGIPLVWVVVASLQLAFAGTARGLSSLGARAYAVTVQAPWLIPYEAELKWMIPAALLVLAIPAYFLSVAIEWLCARPLMPPASRPHALRAVAIANLTSYALLAVLFAAVLASGPGQSSLFATFEPITMALAEFVFTAASHLIGSSSQ